MTKKTKEHREKIQKRKEKQLQHLQNDNMRTQDERRLETLNIIYQLKQNGLTSEYSAVKELIGKLNEYVEKEETVEIYIPFPEKNKIIKGKLPITKDEKPMVMLKHVD